MATLNTLDLKQECTWDDSYFKVWPEITKARIKRDANVILACCNLALEHKFRGSALGVRWKDLMFAIITRHLKNSSFDSMVALVRLEKGMERAAYRTGAQPLAKDVPYLIEGRKVDIVCWKKDLDESLTNPQIQNLVNYVWKHSTEIIDYSSPSLRTGDIKYAA